MNGKLADTLVLTRDSQRLLLDLCPNIIEIRKFLVDVKELPPFSVCRRRFRNWRVDELKDERTAGDDTLSAREEISTNNAACVL
jgi:hypothetical protein